MKYPTRRVAMSLNRMPSRCRPRGMKKTATSLRFELFRQDGGASRPFLGGRCSQRCALFQECVGACGSVCLLPGPSSSMALWKSSVKSSAGSGPSNSGEFSGSDTRSLPLPLSRPPTPRCISECRGAERSPTSPPSAPRNALSPAFSRWICSTRKQPSTMLSDMCTGKLDSTVPVFDRSIATCNARLSCLSRLFSPADIDLSTSLAASTAMLLWSGESCLIRFLAP
eukprot:scaffold2041_cov251-Pinguiococcus_pyrenoidosus.AAC.1